MRVEQEGQVIEDPASNGVSEGLALMAKETDTHIVTGCFLS